jgi:hypothetical protein
MSFLNKFNLDPIRLQTNAIFSEVGIGNFQNPSKTGSIQNFLIEILQKNPDSPDTDKPKTLRSCIIFTMVRFRVEFWCCSGSDPTAKQAKMLNGAIFVIYLC